MAKMAVKNISTGEVYSLDNKTLIHLPSTSDKNMILHGIESGKEINLSEEFSTIRTVIENEDGSQTITDEVVAPFSVYDYISETPEVLVYTESTDDITVKTTTEPFTIYDEFGDEVEALYYTDDETITQADLILEANWSPLDELEGEKQIVTWTDEEDAERVLSVEGLAKEEFVHLNYWINVSDLIGVNVASSGTPAPFVIQRKDNSKYYSYYQGHFFEIPLNERMVHNYGLLPDSINVITTNEWQAFLGSEKEIRFAYLFSNQSIATESVSQSLDATHTIGEISILRSIRPTTPSVSKVEVTVEKFSLEGRMKDIERININNFSDLQFRTNLIMKSKKYKMHDLVVDTFEEDSMDIVNGISLYRPLERDYYGEGVIETETEQLPSYRTKLIINAEYQDCTFEYSLDNGSTWSSCNTEDIIDVSLEKGNDLRIRVTLLNALSSISAISYAWT